MDSNYIDMLKYYIDMLKCLNKARVDYIMVGGWAINLYGYIRATVDLDIWILADRANAKKVYSAFGEFGAPIADIEPDEFADEWIVFQIGVAPCMIDIITKISGVNYSEAINRAIVKEIDGVPVKVISKEDLIANNRASGRTKDLADIEALEGMGQ